MAGDPQRPFAGLKVLDLTQALAGPYATQLMVDLGADVVKVETGANPDNTRGVPPVVEGVGHYFAAINHGKRSLAIDLKRPQGLQLLLQLADRADVMISNYRTGTLASLGLHSEELARRNPRLIQCFISGFGQGPGMYQRKAVYDANIQALAGFMSVTGDAQGGPMRCGVSIGDLFPAMFAAQSITTALYQRERTGRGQVLDVAMFDCLFSLLTYYQTLTQVTGQAPLPAGVHHASVAPMGRFRTSDGYITVAAFTETFWRKLCVALDRPGLADDARFRTMKDRRAHHAELMAELEPVFAALTKDQCAQQLDSHDVPNSPVLAIDEVLRHPLVVERDLLKPQRLPSGRTLQVGRHPVLYGQQRPDAPVAEPAPPLGRDSEAVVRDWLGGTPAALALLQACASHDVEAPAHG